MYHCCESVRTANWDPDQLVRWLCDGDIHFILTHVHQGLPSWSFRRVVDAVTRQSGMCSRLRDHIGFPMGNEVDCPIWLQDKYRYIQGVVPLTYYNIIDFMTMLLRYF